MFLHAIGFGIVAAAVMALAAVGFTGKIAASDATLPYGDLVRRG